MDLYLIAVFFDLSSSSHAQFNTGHLSDAEQGGTMECNNNCVK
jgi:hypothetical protein